MGLDAYAGFQEPQPENVEPINSDALYETLQGGDDFYWRKHARLQEYMQQIWRERKFGKEGKSSFSTSSCNLIMSSRSRNITSA